MKIELNVTKISVLQRSSGTDIVSLIIPMPAEFWDFLPPAARQDFISDGLWLETKVTKGMGQELVNRLSKHSCGEFELKVIDQID